MTNAITTTVDNATKEKIKLLRLKGYTVPSLIKLGIDNIENFPKVLGRLNQVELENIKLQKARDIMQKRIFELENQNN